MVFSLKPSLGLLIAATTFAFLPSSEPAIEILFPKDKKLLVATGAASFTGRYDTAAIRTIELLERFEKKQYIEVATKEQKGQFAKHVRKIFPQNVILARVLLTTHRLRAGNNVNEYRFPLEEEVGLRKFWNSIVFREILASVYDQKVLGSELTLFGWSRRTLEVSRPEHQTKFGGMFSFSVLLNPGMNVFFVRATRREGSAVALDSVMFFYKTATQIENPPAEFAHISFHQEEHEAHCSPCHELELPVTVKKSKSAVENECKTCHAALVNQTSSHVPVAEWECLMCHDPNSSPKYQLYAEKQYNATLCYECHPDKQADIESKPSVHPVTDDCRTCHDPHGSKHGGLVFDRVNTICGVCHEDVAQTPHPVVKHPLEGRPDPIHAGKELSCATCHNPHASDNEQLLIAPRFALCNECHKK